MDKRMIGLLAALSLLAITVFGLGASAARADEHAILSFDTIHGGGVSPFTGGANAIRGVSGSGLPWVIASGQGVLKRSGDLKVEVEGLVIDPNDATAKARGLAGTNPSPVFKVIVSCQAPVGGAPIQVSTDAFPATPTDHAEIEAHGNLPRLCIAPFIFVTSGVDARFATTGLS